MRKQFPGIISILLIITIFFSNDWAIMASATVSANVPTAEENNLQFDEEGLAITYTGPTLAAANPMAVYTAKTKSNSDTSGNGSKENPYNRFEDAVSNVSDGGTIYIMASDGGFINAQDELGNEPFIIGKSITIEPEPGAESAILSCRAAGIILGGNVTFKNIELNFANKYHDVIAANGYKLVLNNVSHDSGSRLVDLVAGSLYDKDSGTRLGPAPGNSGSIEVQGSGSWFGNLYGGSLNGSFSGSSQIIVDGATGMDIGEIYASGAAEPVFDRSNWFDFEEVDPPTADGTSYPVNGTVTITLKNAPVTKVDGDGATGGTKVVYESNNRRMTELLRITDLDVKQGTLEPASLTIPDGKALNVTVQTDGVLDLEEVKSLNVKNFTGGGKLVLDKEATMKVTGELTGTTVLETVGGYNGHSGIALADQVYVEAGTDVTGTFSFTPNPAQSAYKLEKQTDGSWKMINTNPGTGEVPVLTGLRFVEEGSVVTYSQINCYNNQQPPVFTMYLEGVPEETYAEDYPFQYEVTHGGKTYIPVSDSDDPSYQYIEDLHMELSVVTAYEDEGEEDLVKARLYVNVYFDGGDDTPPPVATGDYEITVAYPTENGLVSDSLYLTVVEDAEEGETKTVTVTSVSLDASSKSFGDAVIFSASVTADGQAVEATKLADAKLQLYINGKATGEALTYKNLNEGKVALIVSTDKGFVAGNNSVSIEFQGTDEYYRSVGTVNLTVEKVEPVFSVVPPEEYVYDGKVHPLDAGAFTVESTIEVPITVTYNGEEEQPRLPGVYQTYIIAEETAVSVAMKMPTPNIIITKAVPEIILSDEAQTDGTSKISVQVEGTQGALVPVGTVTLYQNRQEIGSKVLQYGQADFTITPIVGNNAIYAIYKSVEQSCYSDKTSDTITVVGTGTPETIWVKNNGYPTAFTYTANAINTPAVEDFATNGSGTLTFTWYKGTTAAGTALTDEPSEVGAYSLKVELINGGKTEAQVVVPVVIDYLATDKTAVISEKNKGKNGWYVGDVTLQAPTGYSISTTDAGTSGWKQELIVSAEGETIVSYYLRENQTGYIADCKRLTVRKDSIAPTLSNAVLVGGSAGQTSAEITFVSNEAGSFFYAIQKGENAADVSTVLQGTGQTMVAGENSISLTGLTPSTTYTLSIAARDQAGNATKNVFTLKFKTQQAQLAEGNSFVDVEKSDWFYQAVEYAYQNKIMNGIGNQQFDPNGQTTRAMVVQILYNITGKPEITISNRFTDVPSNQWYAKAVQWASDTKVTSGVSATSFAPERNVTRQEVACFLYSYANWKGYDTSGRSDLSRFEDEEEIAGWALEAMKWANNAGIINGKSGVRLDPTGLATRAEIAAMMKGFTEKYQ